MNHLSPQAQLDARYSVPDASATPWITARNTLESAEIYWLTTVRADGRPHVTPLIGVWVGDALYFATGEGEQKAKNLLHNPNCVLTTGCNVIGHGLDVVVEGSAVRVISENQLKVIADAIAEKYGPEWRFDARADELEGKQGNVAWLFRVQPVTVFGFGKGDSFSQTRWSF
jgi:PPOX class probable F420-dependent enzyme